MQNYIWIIDVRILLNLKSIRNEINIQDIFRNYTHTSEHLVHFLILNSLSKMLRT